MGLNKPQSVRLRPTYLAKIPGQLDGIIPWDWSSSRQIYAKLNTAEREMIALTLTSRAGVEASTVWTEIIAGGLEYMLDKE